MTKQNLKPVYADRNHDWRIVYFPGGYWELQEYAPLIEGTDRSRHQHWKAHNSRMSWDDAIVALQGHAKREGQP